MLSFLLFFISMVMVGWLCFPILSILWAIPIRKPLIPIEEPSVDFACIITVYGNLNISIPLVQSLLTQKYQRYHIYLIADRVDENSYPIQDNRLTIFFPESPLGSKVRSIDQAMKLFVRPHDHCAILDPDNLAHEDFLAVLNAWHQKGYTAVQGKRTAKNLDSMYAALDGLGEYYYDFIARQIPFSVGSSSTIAGSGMSIKTDVYRKNIDHEMEVFSREGINVSEDKALQLELVSGGHRIAYAANAILFDEKVSDASQVSRQRTRWLNSYFRHVKDVLPVIKAGFVKRNWNIFYFGLNVLMPPLVILLGSSFFLFLLGLFFLPIVSILLVIGGLFFILNFLISLKMNHAPSEIWNVLPRIPFFIANQILSILKIRKANKDFMQTTHTAYLTIDEVWENRKDDFKHLQNSFSQKPTA